MGRARDAIVAGLVLLAGRARRPGRPPRERLIPRPPPQPRAEAVAIALLFLAALSALAFVLVYSQEQWPAQTQLLGATLGGSMLLLAAALIVAAKRFVPTEELAEDYPPEDHPAEQEAIAQLVAEAGDAITRKGLFKLGLAAAGGALGLALITPALSFGPAFTTGRFLRTPWRARRRLVDVDGRPYRAAEIHEASFYTAFPEGAARDDLAASVILVRLPEEALDLPAELERYPAGGIVAYSSICTHAGCAITLYRVPLFPADSPKAALVCPCHYSTFDPATGGTVTFGPAGRELPMLPLAIDRAGHLRAAGTFNGNVGPSWWGVRNRGPKASRS